MLVGYMDVYKNPTLVATATAIMGAHYNIEIVYFNPKNIDMDKGLINGRQYRNNKWRPVTTKIPALIDAGSKTFNKSFNENTKEIISYLKQNTVLTLDKKGTPNKERLQHLLFQDSNFAHLVIPSKNLISMNILEEFLIKYDSIILKPIYGRQGKGIYSLRKQGEKYILSYGTEESNLNYTELKKFYEKYLVEKKYLVQKMINSKTNEGYPFDCRIVVQKNRTGKWTIGKMFFRIGTGQKVVSNTFQGGSTSDPKPFLKANFGSKWNDVYKKLEEVALTLPYKFEEIKGTPTMDLGLDMGIDENGDLYLFEINHGAAMKRLASISARLRLEYYQYLIETHPDLKKIKKNIRKKNAEKKNLKKERDFYKNEYDKLVKSKSWRLTMPLRKFSSFLKK